MVPRGLLGWTAVVNLLAFVFGFLLREIQLRHAEGPDVGADQQALELQVRQRLERELANAELVQRQRVAKDREAVEEKEEPVVQNELVLCETSKGPLHVEVRRDWSPNGARRFVELVQLGFFKMNAFFRVPPVESNPIAQFGVSPNRSMREVLGRTFTKIQDDLPVRREGRLLPPWMQLAGHARIPQMKGAFGFGGTGTNSRSVQMWIARRTFLDMHHELGTSVWDVPVAQVVNAAALKTGGVIDRISVVGDMKPWGQGPDTGKMVGDPLFETDFPGQYLRERFPDIDYFKSCAIVDQFPAA